MRDLRPCPHLCVHGTAGRAGQDEAPAAGAGAGVQLCAMGMITRCCPSPPGTLTRTCINWNSSSLFILAVFCAVCSVRVCAPHCDTKHSRPPTAGGRDRDGKTQRSGRGGEGSQEAARRPLTAREQPSPAIAARTEGWQPAGASQRGLLQGTPSDLRGPLIVNAERRTFISSLHFENADFIFLFQTL